MSFKSNAYRPAWSYQRNQLRLPFPETKSVLPFLSAKEAKLKILHDRQPKKFPPGWWRLAADDPWWRKKHYDRWSEKRKAAGLPHVVHDTSYPAIPSVQTTRKTA